MVSCFKTNIRNISKNKTTNGTNYTNDSLSYSRTRRFMNAFEHSCFVNKLVAKQQDAQ